MATVPEHFFAHDGKCCDKWENYLDIYDTEFTRFVARETPVALLEIGIQDGGSLEIWQKVFPRGSSFTGIDIDPRVASLQYGASIDVKVGDASDQQVLDGLLADATFDVIIDDGSHISKHIIATFVALFPRLRPGGVYCIEDLACSYGQRFGAGLRHPDAAIEWLKRLIDGLHSEYWNPADVDESDRVFRDTYAPWVERVTFYESLTIVAKRAAPKTRPVRRVLTGRTVSQSDHFRIFANEFPRNPPGHKFGAAFASELAVYIASERDARILPPSPPPVETVPGVAQDTPAEHAAEPPAALTAAGSATPEAHLDTPDPGGQATSDEAPVSPPASIVDTVPPASEPHSGTVETATLPDPPAPAVPIQTAAQPQQAVEPFPFRPIAPGEPAHPGAN